MKHFNKDIAVKKSDGLPYYAKIASGGEFYPTEPNGNEYYVKHPTLENLSAVARTLDFIAIDLPARNHIGEQFCAKYANGGEFYPKLYLRSKNV